MDCIANAAPSASKLLSPGTCVDGKYIICDVLGSGGSATVYAAEQVGLRRVVAFKLYPLETELAPQVLERFQREAQLLARIHHENVVAVFDSGSMPDGSPYLVVQRVQGESLATRLLAGPLPMAEAIDLTRQALHALVALSDAGITHRDVKPDNLVLDRLHDGRVVLKLVDFGVAQEVQTQTSGVPNELVGTPHYMAPEQLRGEPVDARCDLYALGATLYQMLAGCTPHAGETLEEIARATLFGPITPLSELRRDCADGLAQLVMRALARAPADRFASAREMRSALDAWQASQQPALSSAVLPAPTPALEDTLRVPTRRAEARGSARAQNNDPARGRRGRRVGLALAACLAVLGVVVQTQELGVRAAAGEAAGPLAVRESSALDLGLRTSAVVSNLALQTSASAATLLARARDSAHELLELARGATPGWNTEGQSPSR